MRALLLKESPGLVLVFVLIAALSSCGGETPPAARLRPEVAADASSTPQTTVTSDPAVAPTFAPTSEPEPTPSSVTFAAVATIDEVPGSESGRHLATAIRDRLILQTGCGGTQLDPSTVAALASLPEAEPFDHLRSYFSAQDVADQTCFGDLERWQDATRGVVAHLQAYEKAITGASSPPPSGTATEFTSTTVTLYDRVYGLLTGRNGLQGSDLWFSSWHFAAVRGLREDVANGQPPDALVMGSSVMARGVDVPLLRDLTGRQLASVAITGMGERDSVAMIDDILTFVSPSDIIWGISASTFFTACRGNTAPRAAPAIELRREAFGPVAALGDTSDLDRVLGDAAAPTYGDSPLSRNASYYFPEWVHGDAEAFVGTDPERMQSQEDALKPGFESPTTCPNQAAVIAGAVERWEEAGIDVTVVLTPMRPRLIALHPAGMTGYDPVVAAVSEITLEGDAEFADLTEAIADSDFYDLTHLDATGRDAFSRLLAEVLAE